jgi:Ca2+-binding RTX toxin-like protein
LQLTTRADDLTGGAGDDTFDGQTAGEWASIDAVDGAGGTDTLDVTIANSVITGTVSNVETVIIQSTNDGADFDFSNVDTSVATVTVTSSATDLDLIDLQNNVTVEMLDLSSGAAGLTIDFDDNHVGSATATLSLVTNGSTVAVDVVTAGTDAFTSSSITTEGSGTSSASAVTLDLTNHTTLTFAGSSNLELISANGFTELATISGGSATGGLTIDLDDNPLAYNITLGAGNDSVIADQANTGTGGRTIDLGAGNDRLDLAALTPESDDVFTGGDGVDSFVSADTSLMTAATMAGVSGFERLVHAELGGSADLAAFPTTNSISILEVEAGTTGTDGAVDFTNVPDSVVTLELSASTASDGAADAGDDITMARRIDGTANAITVTTTANVQVADELELDDEETITIDSNLGTLTLNTGLSATDLTSLTVAGDNDVDLSAVVGLAVATVDASAMVEDAAFTIASTTSTANMTVTGGNTASYTGVVTVTTGTGSDTITTTGGADVITSGNGNDTITTGAANDDVTSGAGNDTIDAGAGDDTINTGTGTDTVTTGTGNDEVELAVGVNGATALSNGVTTITDFEAGATDDEIEISVEAVIASSTAEVIVETAAQVTTQSDIVAGEIVVYTGNQTIDVSAAANATDLANINTALFDADAIDAGVDLAIVFSADTDGDGAGDEVQVWGVGANDGATDGNADFGYQIATLSNIDATADLAGVFHADNFDII